MNMCKAFDVPWLRRILLVLKMQKTVFLSLFKTPQKTRHKFENPESWGWKNDPELGTLLHGTKKISNTEISVLIPVLMFPIPKYRY